MRTKKQRLRKAEPPSPQPSRQRVHLSTWLLSAALVLAPLVAGRLELGSEPAEPSLRGIVTALFTGGAMLPLAVWLIALLALVATVWEWRYAPAPHDPVPAAARWLAAGLLLWTLLGTATSVFRWGTVVAWSWWAVALGAAWLFSRQQGQGVWMVSVALALGGTLAAAFALREYAENVRLVPNWRVFGTFFNPNFLAGYLCLTMPVTLSLALASVPDSRSPSSPSVRGEWRWLLGFGVWMQMTALLLTGSRFGVASGVLALAVMAGWMAWNRSWNRQRLLFFTLVCLAVLGTAVFSARALTARVTGTQAVQQGEYSGGFRVWTWRGTLRMVQAHPLLGTGLGTYEVAYPRFAYVGFTRLAHNSYLQLMAEAGVPALLLLLGMLGVLAWRVLRTEARCTDEVFRAGFGPPLRAGLAAAIAAGLARNLIDSDWSIFACLFTFWAVVGLLLALSSQGETRQVEEKTLSARGGRFPRLALAHAALLASALLVLTLRVGGSLAANSANWNLSQGVPDLEGYRRALLWEPLHGDHYLSLGTLALGMARAGDRSRAEEAEQALRRAAQLIPYSKTWYHLGNLYRDVLGDPAKAEDAYRRALEQDPHALRVMVELGKTLEAQGKWQEAEALYRRILQIEGSVYQQVRAVPELPEVDYAFAYAGLARIAQRQGKPPEEWRPLYARARQILEEERTARERQPMAEAIRRSPERERALEALWQECERALR